MDFNLKQFIQLHQEDDTDKLLLGKKKWPEIDVDTAVNCILSRRKLRDKVPQWYRCEELIYPNTISAEQCSSSFTAGYKAGLVEKGAKVADLTGGLGVDCSFFAQKASEVLYCEMNGDIYGAAVHNFGVLGLSERIVCRCIAVSSENMDEVFGNFAPDIIYLDPARRSSSGSKVFRLEDCSPNLLELAKPLLKKAPKLIAKLSPMADISLVCKQLEECGAYVSRVHTVGAGGECKELLLEIGAEPSAELETVVAQEGGSISFTASQEKSTPALMVAKDEILEGKTLFEPGKALMKAGAYNFLCSKGLRKFGKSTHLYVCDTLPEELSGLGKCFGIVKELPFDKRSMKAVSQNWPKCEITARNLPLSSDALRQKMGVTSGGNTHIFALKCDSRGNIILVTER